MFLGQIASVTQSGSSGDLQQSCYESRSFGDLIEQNICLRCKETNFIFRVWRSPSVEKCTSGKGSMGPLAISSFTSGEVCNVSKPEENDTIFVGLSRPPHTSKYLHLDQAER